MPSQSIPTLFGFLNLNKPADWSSRQAVDHIKPLVKPAKIGHAGTLDPLATGVLVVCIGRATRLVPYIHDLPKAYVAAFLLGSTSDSDDTEGEVLPVQGAPMPTREEISAVLPRFIGEIDQLPPAYSAVKIRGRRAYDLARRGKVPDLQPRTVTIESIRLLTYTPPQLELEIICGSGTYIRSIGRDLGNTLGTGAVMSRLTRTAVGPFTLKNSLAPEEVTSRSLPSQLQPPQDGLVSLPHLTATEEMLERLLRGLPCPCPAGAQVQEGKEAAVLNEDSQLLLIATVIEEGRELQPRHVFAAKSGQLQRISPMQ